jgi:hypothetical protein
MRKITLVVVALALVLPVAALAAKPTHPTTPASANANTNAGTSSKGASAKVQFILHGTIMGYTAGSSVQIKVSASNFESSTLMHQTLTFSINSKTNVVGTVKVNSRGTVKVRAPKNASAATLQGVASFEVIDQGH